jgi:hypothetical protein
MRPAGRGWLPKVKSFRCLLAVQSLICQETACPPPLETGENIYRCTLKEGDRGSTVVKVCATNMKVAGSIPDGVMGFFR